MTSGVRIGTPAVTTQGMKEPEMDIIADLISRTLKNRNDEAAVAGLRQEVAELCGAFTPYAD